MTWTEIFLAVLIGVVIPALPHIFKLLSGFMNYWDALAKSALDDLALGCVQDIVLGVTMPLAEAYKQAREDGKLSPEEITFLRNLAKEKLIEVGKEKGIDFLKKVGPTALNLILEKVILLVKQSKN